MGEYKIIYNFACYGWEVWRGGRAVYETTTKEDAERWASAH